MTHNKCNDYYQISSEKRHLLMSKIHWNRTIKCVCQHIQFFQSSRDSIKTMKITSSMILELFVLLYPLPTYKLQYAMLFTIYSHIQHVHVVHTGLFAVCFLYLKKYPLIQRLRWYSGKVQVREQEGTWIELGHSNIYFSSAIFKPFN